MKQLLLLEMRKNNYKQFITGGMMASGVLLLYLIVTDLLTGAHYGSYINFFNHILAYNKIIFSLFASMIIVKMFSDEINSKSISILFTYPLARTRLLLVKVILILALTFVMMLASMLVHFMILLVVNGIFHLVENSTLSISLVFTYFIASIIQAALTSLAALIPIYFDVKYASSQRTLIMAAVFALFFYSFPGKSLFGLSMLVTLIAATAGIYLTKLSIEVVSNMDIM